MPTPDELKQWRVIRGKFLNTLWDVEHEGTLLPMVQDVLTRINEERRSEPEISWFVRTLVSDGMVEGIVQTMDSTYPTEVRLTAQGRRELEAWLAEPDQPTEHLPVPANVVFNSITVGGNVQGAALLQGSGGATATATYSAHGQQIANFVERYRQLLPGLDLDDEAREAVEADLVTIQEQAKEPEVQPARVRPLVRRLLSSLGTAAALGAATVAQEEVVHLGQQLLQLPGASGVRGPSSAVRTDGDSSSHRLAGRRPAAW